MKYLQPMSHGLVFSPLLPTSGHFLTNTSTSTYFFDHVDKFCSPGGSTEQKETEGTYNIQCGTVAILFLRDGPMVYACEVYCGFRHVLTNINKILKIDDVGFVDSKLSKK